MILRICPKCRRYSLSDKCCSVKTRTPHPPRFSLPDRYGKYRRVAKQSKEK